MTATPRLAAIVLAAGRSTRMGPINKLTAELDGTPLVRHAAAAACGCGASPVLVVTGHEAKAVQDALAGLPVLFVHNPDFAQGLASSLRIGIGAVPAGIDGAVVLLGDMPAVTATLVRRLIAAFGAEPAAVAAVPVHDGEWGNPVVLAASLFPDVAALDGDAGARKLLQSRRDAVVEVAVSDAAVTLDVDTPDVLAALRGDPLV
jgi:molybdenum cofactor cytidylyltransferase